MQFMGYRRADGTIGVRNHLAVISCGVDANQVAKQIARNVPAAVAVLHQHGANQYGEDAAQTFRTLRGIGTNGNVGGAVIVGMGNEDVPVGQLAAAVQESQKPVVAVDISEIGGTLKAMQQGHAAAEAMASEMLTLKQEPCDSSELIIGLECGGSDFTSGLASNPGVGAAADRIVRDGGTAVLSETTELIGAEHILARRAVDDEVAERLLYIVQRYEDRVKATGFDMRGGNPAPGNIKGGLTTIEEKSLGCVAKAGSTPLVAVVDYAEAVTEKGLYVMDTPGNDVESVSGMVAGGAHIVLFTTGRGTPTGNPVAPVIKVTGNPKTAVTMADNIDVDASGVLTGEKSIDDVGEEIYQLILRAADGEEVKAEILGHREFSIHRIGMTV